MADTKPFTDAHAIAMIEAAVFLQPRLGKEQVKELAKRFDPQLLKQGFKRASSVITEARFKLQNDDEDLVEEIHIHPGMVHFMLFEFRGWTHTRQHFKQRISLLETVTNRVGVGLAVRDIFLNDWAKNFEYNDVFNAESSWLPTAARSRGPEWRYSFSAPEVLTERMVTGSTLFIECKVGSLDNEDIRPHAHVTEITHRQWYRVRTGQESEDNFPDDVVLKQLDGMHQRNKSFMRELLSRAMVEKIGLES